VYQSRAAVRDVEGVPDDFEEMPGVEGVPHGPEEIDDLTANVERMHVEPQASQQAAFSFAAGDPSRPASPLGEHVSPAFQFASPPLGAAPQAPEPQAPPAPRTRVKRPAPVEEKPYDPMDISTHGMVFQEPGQMLIDLEVNPRLVTDKIILYSLEECAATKRYLLKQSRGRSMGCRSREKRRNLLDNGGETEGNLLYRIEQLQGKLEDLQERLRVARQMKELDVKWTAVERQEKRTQTFLRDFEEPPKRQRV